MEQNNIEYTIKNSLEIKRRKIIEDGGYTYLILLPESLLFSCCPLYEFVSYVQEIFIFYLVLCLYLYLMDQY